jgi:endo-1,4-beta-xylanase
MHCNTDLTETGIRNMLERMVKTGKKVRISELDVPQGNIPDRNQAEVIVSIFKLYLEIVPEAQRGGITFWGVSDKNTWLGKGKYPLLYDARYNRKDSYRALHAFLLERSGLE